MYIDYALTMITHVAKKAANIVGVAYYVAAVITDLV
jgi:hypothetical protein